jgi:hypothetical protein
MSVETQQPPQQQTAPPPQPPAPQRQSFLHSRAALIGGIALAVVAAVAAVVIFTGGGSDKKSGGTVSSSSSSKADAFKISYPDSWTPLGKDKLKALPGHPLAVIKRKDGKGLVVVRREQGAPPRDLKTLGASLGKQLKKRIPDLKVRSQKVVKLKSGPALFTSYIRKKTGTVQSVVVVPATGKRVFTLNTVSRGGANDVARETGRMILSFDAR